MKHIGLSYTCILFFAFLSSAAARTIGVPGDSPTIQAGIDAASHGDTVLVRPGRYYEVIDFKGKNIVVGSLFLATRDSSYIINTIIDAQQKNTVAAFQSGETAAAELCGFTITNGKSQANVMSAGNIGGGVFCKNASPYLHHLIVDGNLSELDGGGMYLEKSNSVIEYCVIRNNRAVGAGGGLGLYMGNFKVRNSIIDNNFGSGAGDGIFGQGLKNNYIVIDRVLFCNNYNSI